MRILYDNTSYYIIPLLHSIYIYIYTSEPVISRRWSGVTRSRSSLSGCSPSMLPSVTLVYDTVVLYGAVLNNSVLCHT